ncbi:MAG: type II toxin-antitoxin system VapC family toxin [Bacteroidota bacterium]|nr:type II toxin-antitoxin system VapC family toxin [Bacteroidota bacterium]
MWAFLDTSALVKLYDGTEPDTLALQQRLEPVTRIFLSDLTQVEFSSAFQRKVRRGDLLQQQADAMEALFQQSANDYSWIALEATVLAHAAQLLKQHSATALRSLDAIQLACALTRASDNVLFFTHDTRLLAAAEASGLRIG